jgi:hypothetical protein
MADPGRLTPTPSWMSGRRADPALVIDAVGDK